MRPAEEYLWEAAGDDWDSPAARAAEIVFSREDEPMLVSVMTDAVEVDWIAPGLKETLLVRKDGHYFIHRKVAA